MNRRDAIASIACGLRIGLVRRAAGDDVSGRVLTVRGAIEPSEMGRTLPHEHVLCDFRGAEFAGTSVVDENEVAAAVRPHLERIRELGIRTFVDCTPAYIGRDVRLLAHLSEATGLHILTNTGYYNAAGGKFLPAHARRESADQLAARFIAEARDGIEGSSIRPGFIKIGVDGGALSADSRKLVEAAARAHAETGLVIAAHTGDSIAAEEQAAILEQRGVQLSAWIWVHANNAPRERWDRLVTLANRGAWIEFDGVGPDTVVRHVMLVKHMAENSSLSRVLISHDAGWYTVGTPRGGTIRPYDTLSTKLIPALRDAGIPESDITRLIVDNPREAFTIRKRLRDG